MRKDVATSIEDRQRHMRIICNTIHLFCYGGNNRIRNTFLVKDLKRMNPKIAELPSTYIGRCLLSQLLDLKIISLMSLGKSRRYRRYKVEFSENELGKVLETVVVG